MDKQLVPRWSVSILTSTGWKMAKKENGSFAQSGKPFFPILVMSHRFPDINNGWLILDDSPFPMAYCCSRSIMLMWVTPRRSCISVSQWVTLPLPGPPRTKMTGTFGGSNLTLPVLCIPAPTLVGLPPPSEGERTMAERVSPPLPPPFQSDSSTSCVVLLLSVGENEEKKLLG